MKFTSKSFKSQTLQFDRILSKNGKITSELPPIGGNSEVTGDKRSKAIIAQPSIVDQHTKNEGAVMSTKEHYEKMFVAYPDVVRMAEFRTMLGGVTEATALKILEQGHIKFFFIRRRHLIPKVCIIDYLLGASHTSQEVPLLAQTPGKRRRPGTGCLYQINDHLWEGKYSPRNAHGKRITKNVYAKTRDACEKKLMVLIAQMDRDILAQKVRMPTE